MQGSLVSSWILEAVAAGSTAAVACVPSPAEPTSAANGAIAAKPSGNSSAASGGDASDSAAIAGAKSDFGNAPHDSNDTALDGSAPSDDSSKRVMEERSKKPADYQVSEELKQDCVGGLRNVLADLKTTRSYDYIELRQRFDGQKAHVMMARGEPCARAGDADACHRELARAGDSGFGSSCHPAHCDFQVVLTDSSGVHRFTSLGELAGLLGPIDTPGEAWLTAFADGHSVLGCDESPPQRAGSGFMLSVHEMIAECPVVVADVTLSVASDGSVRVLKTANKKQTGACVGRRPPGLRAPREVRRATGLAGYLAACAHLEAASVPAFERLGKELARLGAPVSLVESCDRAARDEQRHARSMGELARAHGAEPAPVELGEVPLRDAASLALDNAVEGCVRETFGAAVGLYQARHASDPRIRFALHRIARDEVEHAALAWKIAAWVEPLLLPDEREHVRRARRRALALLRGELMEEPRASLRAVAGLPPPASAMAMFETLERTLWGEAQGDAPRASPTR